MGSWPVRVEIRDSSKQSSTQRQQYELPNYTDDYSTAMLYELIGIVRPGNLAEVREIAKTTGTQILSAGGVVRGITNWGIFRLPKPARKHKTLHHNGHYFIVRFDSSSRTQHAVRRTLGLDPRMIRYSVVKMGGTLEEIKKIGGLAEWPGKVE